MKGRKKKYSDEFKVKVAEEAIKELSENCTIFPRIGAADIYRWAQERYVNITYTDVNCTAVKTIIAQYENKRKEEISLDEKSLREKKILLTTFDPYEFLVRHENDILAGLRDLADAFNYVVEKNIKLEKEKKQLKKECEKIERNQNKEEKKLQCENKELRQKLREKEEKIHQLKERLNEIDRKAQMLVIADLGLANIDRVESKEAMSLTYLSHELQMKKKSNLKVIKNEKNQG